MPVPFHPSPAAAPRFDPAGNTWTLSRYEDVSAALADGVLLQGADEKALENELHSAALRNSVQADMARITEKEWAAQAAGSFAEVLNQCGDPADLVRFAYSAMQGQIARAQDEVVGPWSAATRLNPAQAALEHIDDADVAESLAFTKEHTQAALRNLERVAAVASRD